MKNFKLTTKFHIPPSHKRMVTRPRLLEKLNSALEDSHKLVLISAPPGYGKTTLVANWISSMAAAPITERPLISWLSLEEADNTIERFLYYLMAAFQQIDESFETQARSLLEMPNLAPINNLLDTLINALVLYTDTPLVLVLDDYQHISNTEIHQALDYFLSHCPANVHLLLLTREDPPLPLPRLRARSQMTEIRARDLRFSTGETVAYFNLVNLQLPEDKLLTLDERTEGWIAGLQLAALALQNQADPDKFVENFHGSHRFVLDYLAGEVILQQSETLRCFLVQTSVLTRFNAELCAQITGLVESQRIIEELEQSNLFIVPLDDERCWYRYHHLFAEFLRNYLSNEDWPDLLKSAALWHAENNLMTDAVRYALSSGDNIFASEIVERALTQASTWSEFFPRLFMTWLEAIPEEVLIKRPRLCLEAAHIYYTTGQFGQAEKHLTWAEDANEHYLGEDKDELASLAGLYRGLISTVRGHFHVGIEQISNARLNIKPENHLAHASALFSLGQANHGLGETKQAVVCYLQASDEAQAGGLVFPLVNALCTAARLQVLQAKLRLAKQTCQKAIDYADGKKLPQLGLAWIILGGIAWEQNDCSTAEAFLQDGLMLARQAYLNDDITWGLIYLSRLFASQGNFIDALAAIDEAIAIVDAYDVKRLLFQVTAIKARIQLLVGQKQGAENWAAEYELIRDSIIIEHADLSLVRVWIAARKLDRVPEILTALLNQAQEAGRHRTSIEAMLLFCLYHLAEGKRDTAQQWLEKSLQLAEPEGMARIFIDEGQTLQDILPQAREAAPVLVDTIQQALSTPVNFQTTPYSQLLEPLSEQEIRVLDLIVTGKSNAEIANELVITVGTVKWHVHNIYQKLGVSNRPQAIARVRELNQ